MKMGIFLSLSTKPEAFSSVISDTLFKILEDAQYPYQYQCWVFGGKTAQCAHQSKPHIGQRTITPLKFQIKICPPFHFHERSRKIV